MDLQFNTNTGKPIYFQHGPPCDCTCYISPGSGNVCHFSDLCKSYTYFAELLSVVRKFPHLALIYLDSKNKRLSTSVQRLAGKEIINSVEREIFQKGFGGKVLIGAGNSEVYILAVADAARYALKPINLFKDREGNGMHVSILMAQQVTSRN